MSYAPPPSGGTPPPDGTPPPGHPGHYGPPPAKKRKKWPFIVGGIALLMILGCIGVFTLTAAGVNEIAENVDEADKNAKGQNAAAGQVGKAARDGKFEFTVQGMKCGATSVGPKELPEKAQGQFCLVDVSVKNIGTEAQTFDGSSQKAYDAKGTEFSNDTGAELSANQGNSTFLEQINPGNTVKGKLIFDVPKGTKLSHVVLHDSPFSGGIKVPLS